MKKKKLKKKINPLMFIMILKIVKTGRFLMERVTTNVADHLAVLGALCTSFAYICSSTLELSAIKQEKSTQTSTLIASFFGISSAY